MHRGLSVPHRFVLFRAKVGVPGECFRVGLVGGRHRQYASCIPEVAGVCRLARGASPGVVGRGPNPCRPRRPRGLPLVCCVLADDDHRESPVHRKLGRRYGESVTPAVAAAGLLPCEAR